MDNQDQTQKNNSNAKETLELRTERITRMLNSRYVVIGKKEIRGWHAWLAIGIVAGVTASVFLVANKSGEFEPSKAVNAYQCNPNPSTPIFLPGVTQIGNPAYCPKIKNPLYDLKQGPVVLVDEGHNNYGTLSPSADSPSAGRVFALGELLQADGFVVKPLTGSITASSLSGAKILVPSLALSAPYQVLNSSPEVWVHNPAAFSVDKSAYSSTEIAAILDWVRAGGSLVINSEHTPFTIAMESLVEAFGFRLNPNAMGVLATSTTSFKKSTPLHPIFRGRNSEEAIRVVPYIAGGSKISFLSDAAVPLFEAPLASVMFDLTPKGFEASFQLYECVTYGLWFPLDSPDQGCEVYNLPQESKFYSAAGTVVAASRTFGKGRVAVFTEFLSFTSQLVGSAKGIELIYAGLKDERSKLLYPGVPESPNADNTQIILNTFHWLAFKL